jgi:hypothetical protein
MMSMFVVSGPEQPATTRAVNIMIFTILAFIFYSHFLVSILKSTAFVLGATTLKLKDVFPVADIGSHVLVFVPTGSPSASSHWTLYLKRLVLYDFL